MRKPQLQWLMAASMNCLHKRAKHGHDCHLSNPLLAKMKVISVILAQCSCKKGGWLCNCFSSWLWSWVKELFFCFCHESHLRTTHKAECSLVFCLLLVTVRKITWKSVSYWHLQFFSLNCFWLQTEQGDVHCFRCCLCSRLKCPSDLIWICFSLQHQLLFQHSGQTTCHNSQSARPQGEGKHMWQQKQNWQVCHNMFLLEWSLFGVQLSATNAPMILLRVFCFAAESAAALWLASCWKHSWHS